MKEKKLNTWGQKFHGQAVMGEKEMYYEYRAAKLSRFIKKCNLKIVFTLKKNSKRNKHISIH